MSTGNHYWLDVAAGIAVAGIAALDRLPPPAPARMSDAAPGGDPGPGASVSELDRVKQEYTRAAREILQRSMRGVAKTKLTPDMLTLAGVTLCLAGAVLVGFEQRNEYLFFWLGGALFVVGSIADILDGALARAGEQGDGLRRLPRLDLRPRRRGGNARRRSALSSCTTATRSRSWRAFAAVIGSFLVSLHARQGGGARVARRCRLRLPRRARRPDLDRSRSSPLGLAAVAHLRCSPRAPGSRSANGSCSSAAQLRELAEHRSLAPVARSAIVLAVWLLALPRTGVLVRMPAHLKGALVREPPARGSNVNDVAAGMLAERLGVPYEPSGRDGRRSRARARRPPPRAAGTERRDPRSGCPLGRQRERHHPRRARHELGVPAASNRKGNHGFDERLEERRAREGQGARRSRRRRQLRQLAPAGRRVLQGRRPGRLSPASCTSTSAATTSRDIEFVAAFDVVKGKVGVDLADAIWAHPNDTIKFANVPKRASRSPAG